MLVDKLDGSSLEIKYIHSSGPGGQNVNKVATAAQLRFDLERSGLPEKITARFRALFPGPISADGVVVITVRNHRSQILNKTEALTRLEKMLALASAPPPKPRKATRPSRRAVERRLNEKKQKSRQKADRARPRSWDKD